MRFLCLQRQTSRQFSIMAPWFLTRIKLRSTVRRLQGWLWDWSNLNQRLNTCSIISIRQIHWGNCPSWTQTSLNGTVKMHLTGSKVVVWFPLDTMDWLTSITKLFRQTRVKKSGWALLIQKVILIKLGFWLILLELPRFTPLMEHITCRELVCWQVQVI